MEIPLQAYTIIDIDVHTLSCKVSDYWSEKGWNLEAPLEVLL